jgi:hypothetical protein
MIGVVVLVLAYALNPFKDSNVLHQESSAAAAAAISSLPYPITLTNSARDPNVLVGQVMRKARAMFRFYVVVDGPIPSWLRRSIGVTYSASSLTSGYSYIGPLAINNERAGGREEQTTISLAIQEALCHQATKSPCPV